MIQAPVKIAFTAAVAIAISALAVAQFTTAASLWMNDTELRGEFGGKEISGYYASGKEFRENYHPDGSLTYMEFGRKNTGSWSITNGTFCTIYDTTTSGGCYQVSRTGSNCFEFYFVARTRKQAAIPKDHTAPSWTARAWLREKQSTCQDESVV